ncbi:MAG: AMP-binding protein [Clostridia bacterium]|nr:AMP-binding protein [Clostridia bacterium]
MIETFEKTCKNNAQKTAFISKGRRVTFQRLLSDVYKMANMLQHNGLHVGSKALLFALPGYKFYVLLFACVYCGVNVFVLDAYKKPAKIVEVMEQNGIDTVFCDNRTGLLKGIFPQNAKFLNINCFAKHSNIAPKSVTDESCTVITTFTSGTTGQPKPIGRSILALKEQIQSISQNVDIANSSVVLVALPIYVLFVVYGGASCLLSKSIDKNLVERYNVDTVIAPISMLLKTKGVCCNVKNTYCGGARLYKRQVEDLERIFPCAHRWYVYGATECALIGKTNLKNYLETYAIQKLANGLNLSFVDVDKLGIGKICVSGNAVLTREKRFVSGDLGLLDENGLHIVGRAKYSTTGVYNYLLDDEILEQNPMVKRGFSFVFEGKIFFCYEGKAMQTREGVQFVSVRKLPMDAKHKTKLDYHKMVEILQKRKLI